MRCIKKKRKETPSDFLKKALRNKQTNEWIYDWLYLVTAWLIIALDNNDSSSQHDLENEYHHYHGPWKNIKWLFGQFCRNAEMDDLSDGTQNVHVCEPVRGEGEGEGEGGGDWCKEDKREDGRAY